jgi:hypothetical protein
LAFLGLELGVVVEERRGTHADPHISATATTNPMTQMDSPP